MGLFVREDGHFRSWLAALLCCWAAVGEDEYPVEKKSISRPTASRNTIWNEQPTPLQPMTSMHTAATTRHKGIENAFNEQDRVRPISERPPSLKPLDFGDNSLLGRMSLHARRKSSTTMALRSSIGRPYDFRRMEYTEKQRRSLIPLQLCPVVLREHNEEPMAGDQIRNSTHDATSLSSDALTDAPNRNSYRASRGTPFERCQQLSALSSSPSLSVNEQGQIMLDSAKGHQFTRPTLSTQSSSSSMHSLRRQALESSASNASSQSRNSTERTRLKRKRSSQKSTTDNIAVDREILELNTIVEERRQEAPRPQSPDNTHVPAVAPLMQVRARSTTLTDIGSAFSRPRISITTTMDDAGASTHHESLDLISPVTPVKSRLSRPFMSMPDPAVVEEAKSGPIRRPSSRVTGWLSTLLSSSEHKPAPTQEPFYSCRPSVRRRAVSEASLCTTVTELESPVLTATSSPTSKGHSRSYTGDSRLMTPTSPLSTVDGSLESDLRIKSASSGDRWTTSIIMEHPSQVGLAL